MLASGAEAEAEAGPHVGWKPSSAHPPANSSWWLT